METNHLGIKDGHNNFLPRFTCLSASYSSLWRFTHLEVHALIGFTRQTLNRVPHNQHKMRITQATSNSLKYLLALCRGQGQEPLTITTIGAGDNHHLHSTILAAPSRLGGGNHQEQQAKSVAKHEH